MVLVDFLDREPLVGSVEEATGKVIGHSLFCLINVLNVSFLLIVQWIILGRLQRSNVLKLTLLGCFCQVISCFFSVIKWNIGDPLGPLGMVACFAGIAGHIPIDIAFIYAFFYKGYATALARGSVFFIIVGISLVTVTYVNWDVDDTPFKYLKMYHLVSVIWRLVTEFRLLSAFKNGDVSLSESIISADSMSKLLLVVPVLDIAAVLCNVLGSAVFKIPATGIGFMNAVLLFVYVGKMDHIEKYRALP